MMRILPIVFLLVVSVPVYSQQSLELAVQKGMAFLSTSQSEDGSWGKRVDLATAAYAINAYSLMDRDVTGDRDYLATRELSESQDLIFQLLGTQSATVRSELQALRNADGSYGPLGSDRISSTALALVALKLAGGADSGAGDYLLSRQNPEGSWGDPASADLTALSAFALLKAQRVEEGVSLAVSWLVLNQTHEGGWDSPAASALGIMALQLSGDHDSEVARAASYLIGRQNPGGGFGAYEGAESDRHSTALILWSLNSVGQEFTGRSAAVDFLEVSRNGSNCWFDEDAALRDTEEAMDTLQTLNEKGSDFQEALSWVEQAEAPNTDSLSRRTSAKSFADLATDSERNRLLAHQLNDGGWGIGSDDSVSNLLDSGMAAWGLADSGYFDTARINRTTQYFVSSQADSGSWGFFPGENGTPWVSARAISYLKRYRRVFSLETPIDRARGYLESVQNGDGGWGSSPSQVWTTALVFSGIMGTNFSTNAAQQALDFLLNAQNPDGSWNGSAFDTAVAIRALVDSKPNLKVEDQDITFSGAGGTEGDIVQVDVVVQNTGGFSAGPVKVRFFRGDPFNNGTQIGDDQTISTIAAGGSQSAGITWDTTRLGGIQRIYVLADPEGTISEGNEFDNSAANNFLVSTKPDLTVPQQGIIYTPEFPMLDEEILFTVGIDNIGETPAVGVVVSLFDGTTKIGGSNPLTVGPGSRENVFFTTMLAAGSHSIRAVIDPDNVVNESNEGNNESAITLEMGYRLDLVLNRIYYSNDMPAEGDILALRAEVYNANADPATQVQVGFYLDGPAGSGQQIGFTTISSINGGTTATTDAIQWDTMGHSGAHRIYVMADPNNLVVETNENNNLSIGNVFVTNLPELIMGNNNIKFYIGSTDSSPVTTVPLGTQLIMQAALSNNGRTTAYDVGFQFYNGNPAAEGVALGSALIADQILYKSGPESDTTANPYPWLTTYLETTINTDQLGRGTHLVYGWIDPENLVLEHNDEDNTGYSVLVVGDQVDLILRQDMTAFSDLNPEEGDIVHISTVVENPSDLSVMDFQLGIYDGDPANGGELIRIIQFSHTVENGVTHPAIGPHATVTGTTDWDTDLERGYHEIFLVVDPNNQVSEINEANNSFSQTVHVVQATRPDLAIHSEDIYFSPTNIAVGDITTAFATVHNTKRLAAGNVAVRFLRIDPMAGEQQIGADQVIPVIGEASSARASLQFSTAGMPNNSVILVKVDPDNHIDEKDESNNVASTALPLMLPDSARAQNVTSTVDYTDVYLQWQDPNYQGIAGYYVLRDGTVVNFEIEDQARAGTMSASVFDTIGGTPSVDCVSSRAADGDYDTWWQGTPVGSPASMWFEVRMTKPQYVAEIVINWKQIGDSVVVPRDYQIVSWTDGEWHAVADIHGNIDPTAIHRLDQPVRTDRIRLVITSSAAKKNGITEIKVNTLRPVR